MRIEKFAHIILEKKIILTQEILFPFPPKLVGWLSTSLLPLGLDQAETCFIL